MADLKITQLDNAGSQADTDLFETVQDVATTPANKKISWSSLKATLKTYFDSLYDSINSASAVQDNLDDLENSDGEQLGDVIDSLGSVGDDVATTSKFVLLADTTGNPAKTIILDDLSEWISGYTISAIDGATLTFTNKRITPRVGSTASSATPTINTDNVDCYSITALATNITSMTTNLSGTPTNFQKLLIRIKDNGSARTISWGSDFESGSKDLPTTTEAGKTLLVGLVYDSVDSKWACEASGSRS